VPAERPAKRARFALADSSTELSYEAVLSWRDCYVSDMVELREKEAERQMMRKGAQEGIRLAFAPGLDCERGPWSELSDV
jgi:alkyl sulfatase BDS1-like metallo-beta-lactamase superfamily hydrolase